MHEWIPVNGIDMVVLRYAIPIGISCIDSLSTGPPGIRVSHLNYSLWPYLDSTLQELSNGTKIVQFGVRTRKLCSLQRRALFLMTKVFAVANQKSNKRGCYKFAAAKDPARVGQQHV